MVVVPEVEAAGRCQQVVLRLEAAGAGQLSQLSNPGPLKASGPLVG